MQYIYNRGLVAAMIALAVLFGWAPTASNATLVYTFSGTVPDSDSDLVNDFHQTI